MLDLTKPYQTRKGAAVSGLFSFEERPGSPRIGGLVRSDGGRVVLLSWTAEGKYTGGYTSSYDLIEVKKTKKITGSVFVFITDKTKTEHKAVFIGEYVKNYRQSIENVGYKFTETPFELEVEIPS